MRNEGLIGAVGAGMNQAEMLTQFVREVDVDVVLCAGRYTLLDHRGLADLLPACEERGVSVMLGGAFNSGLLANPRPGATFNYLEAPPKLVAKAQEMQRLCMLHGVPLTAAALQFPLAHPAVAAVLTGPRPSPRPSRTSSPSNSTCLTNSGKSSAPRAYSRDLRSRRQTDRSS